MINSKEHYINGKSQQQPQDNKVRQQIALNQHNTIYDCNLSREHPLNYYWKHYNQYIPKKEKTFLRILTLNVHVWHNNTIPCFRKPGWFNSNQLTIMLNYINPDIICFQEFQDSNSKYNKYTLHDMYKTNYLRYFKNTYGTSNDFFIIKNQSQIKLKKTNMVILSNGTTIKDGLIQFFILFCYFFATFKLFEVFLLLFYFQ